MAIRIEQAKPEHWLTFRALRLEALQDAPDAFASTAEAERIQPESFWRGRLQRPDVITFVAYLDDRPAGITVVAPAPEQPNTAGVYGVWVAPWARGKQVGDAILREAIRVATELRYQRLILDVGDYNSHAQKLYARMGFSPTGQTSSLPAPREHVTEHELEFVLPSSSKLKAAHPGPPRPPPPPRSRLQGGAASRAGSVSPGL